MKIYVRVIVIILAVAMGMLLVRFGISTMVTSGVKERSNTQCTTTERVFDEADVLTDAEEDALRERIAEAEEKVGADIVLFTIYEDSMNGENDYYYYAISDYVEELYDTYQFGWDEETQSAIIYVDNWSGNVGMRNSYFCPFGNAKNSYTQQQIYDDVDYICEITNSSPFGAYKRYVDGVESQLTSLNMIDLTWGFGISVLIALGITVVFMVTQLIHNKGKKTTEKSTYVQGGHPDIKSQTDTFLTKHTTKRRIESSSGGGGGGGRSGGGGGGGGRH